MIFGFASGHATTTLDGALTDMAETRRQTPSWAVQPINMDEAAGALGVSRRTLSDLLKDHPHYERRRNKYVFYPEHIKRLRREIHECAFKSNGSTVGHSCTGPDPLAGASDNLSKLAILSERRKSAPQ